MIATRPEGATAFSPGLKPAHCSKMRGLKPGRRILVLAGTNTCGVQALAEFVSRPDLIGELLSRLPLSRGSIPDFEALVEVKISGGVPIHSRLVRPR
jgi:hypothetical protein